MPRTPKKTGTQRSRGGEKSTRHQASKASEKLPPVHIPRPLLDKRDPSTKKLYGELLGRYDDLPPVVAQQLVESEISGTVRSLRLRDIIPTAAPAQLISGEMAMIVQRHLDALGKDYEPEDYMRVLMTTPELPFNVRTAAARELMPYRHSRKAPALVDDPDKMEERSVLVVSGIQDADAWEKASNEHHARAVVKPKGRKTT